MTGDELRPDAIAGDDALLEQLRTGAAAPEAGVDPAADLLRALLADVADGAEGAARLRGSAGAGFPLAGTASRDVVAARRASRALPRGAAVAAVTAGVLALGGVAAASPFQGLRHAVADVVVSVTHFVAPGQAAGGDRHPVPSGSTGSTGSTASAVAAARVALLLDRVSAALAEGRPRDAAELLAVARTALRGVRAADGSAALTARAEALASRLAEVPTGAPLLEGTQDVRHDGVPVSPEPDARGGPSEGASDGKRPAGPGSGHGAGDVSGDRSREDGAPGPDGQSSHPASGAPERPPSASPAPGERGGDGSGGAGGSDRSGSGRSASPEPAPTGDHHASPSSGGGKDSAPSPGLPEQGGAD